MGIVSRKLPSICVFTTPQSAALCCERRTVDVKPQDLTLKAPEVSGVSKYPLTLISAGDDMIEGAFVFDAWFARHELRIAKLGIVVNNSCFKSDPIRPPYGPYWKAIGLFAGYLQVSVQDLTVVILIHELAHAYSHVGRDIDGKQWETGAFAETDLEIVEGIAQFYTWVISDKLSDRAPGVKAAFEALLSKQGGPYVAHCGWIEDTERIGEVMRDCLIETRSNGIRELREFSYLVKMAGKRFGHKSAT